MNPYREPCPPPLAPPPEPDRLVMWLSLACCGACTLFGAAVPKCCSDARGALMGLASGVAVVVLARVMARA